MKEIFQMSAKTFYGFEDILCEELKKIDAIDVIKSNRIVHFKGNKEMMYKANLCLRTALKILLPIAKRKISNYESLYKFSFNFEWEKYFDKDSNNNFAISTFFQFTGEAIRSKKIKIFFLNLFMLTLIIFRVIKLFAHCLIEKQLLKRV